MPQRHLGTRRVSHSVSSHVNSTSDANAKWKSHYVAMSRKTLPGQDETAWVMFNDEKVAKLEDVEQMKRSAYMYFFTRL